VPRVLQASGIEPDVDHTEAGEATESHYAGCPQGDHATTGSNILNPAPQSHHQNSSMDSAKTDLT
jgi:hypothetical protein